MKTAAVNEHQEAFAVPTSHGVIVCLSFILCASKGMKGTADFGLKCCTCSRNRYPTKDAALTDNYVKIEDHKVITMLSEAKQKLIKQFIETLNQVEEQTFANGCTVHFEVNLSTSSLKVTVIDNLAQARLKVSQAIEHLQKATVLFTEEH